MSLYLKQFSFANKLEGFAFIIKFNKLIQLEMFKTVPIAKLIGSYQ